MWMLREPLGHGPLRTADRAFVPLCSQMRGGPPVSVAGSLRLFKAPAPSAFSAAAYLGAAALSAALATAVDTAHQINASVLDGVQASCTVVLGVPNVPPLSPPQLLDGSQLLVGGDRWAQPCSVP